MQKTNPDAWLSKRAGTMLGYADLGGDQPSLQDVHDKLRPLNRTNVVERLAWINALTNSWQLVENSDDDRRVRAYVLPNWQARIENWCKNNNNNEVWIFPRFTVLWLMRQAFVACSPEGERIDTREELERLGEACLMANNVAPFPNQPERLATSLEIAVNLVPNIDYFSRGEHDLDIARMHYILTDVAPASPKQALREFPGKIERLLGCSLNDWRGLAILTAMMPMSAETSAVDTFRLPDSKIENFANPVIAPEQTKKYLQSISCDERGFAQEFSSSTAPAADLTFFREYPFLWLDDVYVPLDAGFILDKAGRGLLWSAIKRAKGTEGGQLLTDWGHLVEAYVNQLLQLAPRPGRRVIPNPQFSNGNEAFDTCIIEGQTMIVVETKSGTIPSAAKYSNDSQKFGAALTSKFVDEGLAQLSKSILRFDSGQPLHDSTGAAVSLGSISKIIPVLASLEDSLRAPMLSDHLSQCFQDMGMPKRIVMTPLLLLPVTGLEEIVGYLGDFDLTLIIESFLTSQRTDPLATFRLDTIPMLKGSTRPENRVLDRFRSAWRDALGRLFPAESAEEFLSRSI